MSDVKWSDLFPRTMGGKGGSFKSVVVKTSPYQVKPFERLIIDATTQPFVIDPSLLKEDDDAFEIVDAARAFSKNPVTIKGDKIKIQMAGDGNDLILDMIGAGNTWGFVFAATDLFVAYSPENTSGGGSGGGASITVDDTLDETSTNAIQNRAVARALKALPAANGRTPLNPVVLTRDPIRKDDSNNNIPSRTEMDAAKPKDYEANYGDFIHVITTPFSGGYTRMAGHLTINLPPAVNDMNPIRIIRDGGKNVVYMPDKPAEGEDYEVIVAAPRDGSIQGTWGIYPGSMTTISLDDPYEYVELSAVVWPDGQSAWVITGSGYDNDESEFVQTTQSIVAEPGDHIVMQNDGKVTLPKLSDAITSGKVFVMFAGSRDMQGKFIPDGSVTFDLQDKIFGVFRNKPYTGTENPEVVSNSTEARIELKHAGEWIEFTPTEQGYWLIRGAVVV